MVYKNQESWHWICASTQSSFCYTVELLRSWKSYNELIRLSGVAMLQSWDHEKRKKEMRKLKLQVQMSIDGFIAGPNGEMDWINKNWGDDINNYIASITEPIDTIVLGRKLAEGFIPYWAGVAANPVNPEYLAGRKFTNTHKVVFSKTLEESKWDNTVLAKGDLLDEINKLKKQSGNDIIAYGGAIFVSALIKNRLIDEYHLFVSPTAIGKGMAIFKELNGKQDLALIKSRSFECGIVAINYEPKRH
jgi:dihydrofolate reductase